MKPSRAARYLLNGLMFLRNALRWMALNQRAWAALASSNARLAFSMWRYHTNCEQKICCALQEQQEDRAALSRA